MKKPIRKSAGRNRALRLLILSLILSANGVVASTSPAMAASSCNGPGWLCFYDYGRATYGNVSGNNNDWGAFGWNDRADWFYNWGNYYNVCIYKDRYKGGDARYLPIGYEVYWYNVVSSNAWVTYGGAMCPR